MQNRETEKGYYLSGANIDGSTQWARLVRGVPAKTQEDPLLPHLLECDRALLLILFKVESIPVELAATILSPGYRAIVVGEIFSRVSLPVDEQAFLRVFDEYAPKWREEMLKRQGRTDRRIQRAMRVSGVTGVDLNPNSYPTTSRETEHYLKARDSFQRGMARLQAREKFYQSKAHTRLSGHNLQIIKVEGVDELLESLVYRPQKERPVDLFIRINSWDSFQKF